MLRDQALPFQTHQAIATRPSNRSEAITTRRFTGWQTPWNSSRGTTASRTTSSTTTEMRICWADEAREDYLWWQTQGRRTLKRINSLTRDIARNGNKGLGKPEALRHQLSGYRARLITEEHRLVHRITDPEIQIAACRYHYGR